MSQGNNNPSGNDQDSAFMAFVNKYGDMALGLLAALGALIAAVFMVEFQSQLVGGAGTLALFSVLFRGRRSYLGYRALGLLAAGACVVFAALMPLQALSLISTAGTIAVLTLLFTT